MLWTTAEDVRTVFVKNFDSYIRMPTLPYRKDFDQEGRIVA